MLGYLLLNFNEESFQKIYIMYKDAIFVYVLSITKDYHLSEDITQEVFMRIIKYHKSYNILQSGKSWIFKIAKNVSYTYLTQNNEKALDSKTLEFYLNKCNTIKNDDSLLVEYYLSKLNDDERNIVILHIYGGLNHLEIANVMGQKHSQIRSKYSYAIKKMKALVNKNEK